MHAITGAPGSPGRWQREMYESGAAALLDWLHRNIILLSTDAIHSAPPPRLSVTIEARRILPAPGFRRFRRYSIPILPFLSINSRNEEFRGGGIVEASASDRELIAVMRQYFAVKAELESLKEQLEAARRAAGEAIGVFYDPRQNAAHAADLQRAHRLRGEMASLMQRAEAWGRAASAADRHDGSGAEADPEEWQEFERRADSLFGA
ncbi:hypothetical protein [Sinorhizobium psoraleae]|uniref:Uncharacterized protein n=1 Tax=Sinorhizobium psoraleae TaxID=520838 RepID=A0ABT4K9Y1_9HYPH|nr:hypothetical protein [Sinorhizobium psoraleae]MCZ4088765.1 hypothetical protein [Sinorhizobium psoraleae]